MYLVTREDWGALPPKGTAAPFGPGWGDFLVVHYTGVNNTPNPTDRKGRGDYIRAIQTSYQNGGRGDGKVYVDIPYSYAIWNNGDDEVWELRGLRMRTGANGDAVSNAVWPSVLVVVGPDTPTIHPEVSRKVAALVSYLRDRSGRHTKVKGHRDVFNTACPGGALYKMVTDGSLLPENQNGDEDMFGWRDTRYKNVFHAATGICVAPSEVANLKAVTDDVHDPKLAACCRASWGMSADQAVAWGLLIPA